MGRGEAGKKSADATQLELSFVNEPRCLRDKEDEILSFHSPARIDTQKWLIFLDQAPPSFTRALHV